MAIYHLSTKSIKRSDGKSAVAAAAYRIAGKLFNERTGKPCNYSNKKGVLHTEIILPTGSTADWAMDRNLLWNSAERAENRKNSRTAREIEISLPHELDEEQRLELAREFAQQLADKYGIAADLALHDQNEGKNRNFHIHILLTTRVITQDGFGAKSNFEKSGSWLRLNGQPSAREQIIRIREEWCGIANVHLAKAGFDIRIDHKSFEDRGINLVPTRKIGVAATQMKRKGLEIEREPLDADDREFNKNAIIGNPNEVLSVITSEKSVFTYRDIARAVYRYVAGSEFQKVFTCVMNSSELIELQPQKTTSQRKEPAKLSSREMVNTEIMLAESAQKLSNGKHLVTERSVERILSKISKSRKWKTKLSDEQQNAVRHITAAPTRIAAVVGHAGSGKSTMLKAAKLVWESRGYRVVGAALSGKAADGLRLSSDINAQTLASLERSWNKGYRLKRKDVLVVDEAGMVDSRQLARIAVEVEKRGAKLVLVGDPQQLQPIGPGAAFRAVVNEIGAVGMTDIRRQKTNWQREASSALAVHKTAQALNAYHKHGNVEFSATRMEAVLSIAKDYCQDCDRKKTKLAMAATKKDVQKLNSAIRARLLVDGRIDANGTEVATGNGKKTFATGDRIMLTQNDLQLNVRNGSLATVTAVSKRKMKIALDDGRKVSIQLKKFNDIDYGYAATIHKSQGTTVDRTFVLAGKNMDANLTYVSMTRHSEDAKLHAVLEDFKNITELSEKLSRSSAKETTLDAGEFGKRRGLDSEFALAPAPKHFGKARHKSKQDMALVQINQAIDEYANYYEQKVWLKKLKADPELLPEKELEEAYGNLDKAHPELANLMKMTIEENPKEFDRRITELSGSERVSAIKSMINKMIDKLKAEKSPEAEPAPAPPFSNR